MRYAFILMLTVLALPGAGIAQTQAVVHFNYRQENTYFNRGLKRYDRQDYAGAIRDFNRVIRLNPSNGAAYYRRGFAKSKLRDTNGARLDYNMATTLGRNKTMDSPAMFEPE